MEDMCTKNFAASWKTWTGARQLCQLLPDKYTVKRLSFFKKISGSTQFAYILIAQIAHLMMDCAPALNVLNCLKPKICAFVGTYRIVTFKAPSVGHSHKKKMFVQKTSGRLVRDRVWVRKKPTRKLGCVMFHNEFPFPTKELEVPRKSPTFDRKKAIEQLIMDLVNDPLDDDNSSDELIKPPRRAHSESRMGIEKRKLDVADDDSLLHRLKLNYFNSPDYTIAELREINSD
ncbi:hypothetical protein TELCIR_07820 [Teladorsagia circumcincta]|uniref:DUF7153 domain-containing protein n=1 Tax=Teladorsagia circumcincta TaxID=45464 RepID=A0A2G9UKT2_TELCI|nr:hypothetical protein TELCIR_07820 [Teladorsagia circumcincta]